jgi:hypothetical protein
MNMTFKSHITAGLLATLIVASPLTMTAPRATAAEPGSIADVEQLRLKQREQQRARDMARELIGVILDSQLGHLEANGLDESQLYQDIRLMRNNINGLVEEEMLVVVELLAKAREIPAEQRPAVLSDARIRVSEIIRTLLTERHRLRLRLRVAELTAQVKRLIELQTQGLETTQTLGELPQTQRETNTLLALGDQRDIKSLFLQLVTDLTEVSTRDGEVGAGAADGLGILRAGRVGMHVDEALTTLEMQQFADTVDHQQGVLRGLRLLLRKLEEVQGLIGHDRDAARQFVDDLVRRQEELREKTEAADLTDATQADQLIDEQAAIQEDIGKLSEAIADLPRAESLMEQARSAANEAKSELFQGDGEQAADEQGEVLGNLAEIRAQLDQAAEAERGDRSADEQAEAVAALEQASEALQAAMEAQKPVSEKIEAAETQAQAAEAKPAAEAVAEAIAEAAAEELPPAVQARVRQAAQAAEDAAEALTPEKPAAEPMAQQRAQENAEVALERAAAEVTAELADAKRRLQATKIGELARAAESLERAAAAEREIAETARDAATGEGLNEEALAALTEEQDKVNQVAEKVAEGVAKTAPEAKEALAAAKEAGENIKAQLNGAMNQPREETPKTAGEVATKADANAAKLTEAADAIREEIIATAEELAELSGEQLEQVAAAREAVENELNKPNESVAEKIAKIEAAEQRVREAQMAQQKAAGRPEAAEAMATEQKVAELARKQDAASDMADDVAEGKTGSPVDAAQAQRQVADAAAELAQQAADRPAAQQARAEGKPDELAEALDRAQRAAEKAAEATLGGNDEAAEMARAQAEQALNEAAEVAAAETQAAAEKPAGQPDAAAQAEVSKAAAEAQQLAAAMLVDYPRSRKGLEGILSSNQDFIASNAAQDLGKLAVLNSQIEKTLNRLGEPSAGR